ncbi:MAG: tetratricopeptide repeat protein, partial [Planctomycetaceae bacterium]|nr:tetratricopeptide repeat protein [Planctomycetaceae bacterium]
MPMVSILRILTIVTLLGLVAIPTSAQEKPAEGPAVRGSLVEDRAAAKLLEAGDARFDADEFLKAVEVWESVIERYPRSKVRFTAHMRLGNYLLERERAFDRARTHFEAAAADINTDEEQRAEATLKMGVCFYEARNYGKCFTVMRDVVEKFPVSSQVNSAYYYIGLGHFQLGHYSRAIDALEKVGTTLSGASGQLEKVEAGKRLFIKIDDADLAAIEAGRTVKITIETTAGDKETIDCHPVGRNVRVVLGSVLTSLGKPNAGNGVIEVKGDDQVRVIYTDEHTGDRQFNRPVNKQIPVVGNAVVQITDGAFSETLRGVVLDKPVNLQIIDSDYDLTDEADSIKAYVELLREKTQEEIEADALKNPTIVPTDDSGKPKQQLKLLDRVEIVFTEAKIERTLPLLPKNEEEESKKDDTVNADKPATPGDGEKPSATEPGTTPVKVADDGTIHSGVFRSSVDLAKAEEVIEADKILQAQPGDILQVTYLDRRHTGEQERTVVAQAKVIEGNLGGVRVTRAQ